MFDASNSNRSCVARAQVFIQKRKAFDAKLMRAEGTDNEKFVREQQMQEKRGSKAGGRGGNAAASTRLDDRPAASAAQGKKVTRIHCVDHATNVMWHLCFASRRHGMC